MKAKDRIYFNCENCNKDCNLSYIDYKKNYKNYGKHLCRGCRQKIQYEKGIRDRNLIKNSVKPQKGVSMKERCNMTDEEYFLFRKKLSEYVSGKNNPMYGDHNHTKGLIKHNDFRKGKTFEEIFGKEKAKIIKSKLSISNSGSNNPMFGKPSPIGSGNGWSGWYNNIYFRSLLELSFLIVNKNAKSAEYIKIPYKNYKNVIRIYHPDFIEKDFFYEIKPKKLLNSKDNILKFQAAEKYCKNNQLIYKILTEDDIKKISTEEIKELYLNKQIKFIERYEKRYINEYFM